jgi:thiosulfate/3-mercaptopyruvate sulfurtransferase
VVGGARAPRTLVAGAHSALYDAHGAFLPEADLRRAFATVDPYGEAELITYCTIGGRAATAWFVLTELLGRASVRVYHGSWAEWGLLPDSLIETTDPARTERANAAA